MGALIEQTRHVRRLTLCHLANQVMKDDSTPISANEINTTFYRIRNPKMTRSWVDRAADHPVFRFSAKLWQGFTPESQASRQDEIAFQKAFAPLHDAERLGAVLMQFPYRFHDTADNREHLRQLVAASQEYPVILAVRHRSWDRPQRRRPSRPFQWLV